MRRLHLGHGHLPFGALGMRFVASCTLAALAVAKRKAVEKRGTATKDFHTTTGFDQNRWYQLQSVSVL